MQTIASKFPGSTPWREFYKAAILELDSTKLPGRIEKALIERARELFQKNGESIEEEQALDDAMYALHALRSACKRNMNMSERQADARKAAV